jgi:hypothetical protein
MLCGGDAGGYTASAEPAFSYRAASGEERDDESIRGTCQVS